jgi:large subunit ribosomal protein L33
MGSKKKVGARVKMTLNCSECKRKNYTTIKNKKNSVDKIELKKYCPYDKKHTVHKEGKI